MFADFENMVKGKINAIKEPPSTDISRVAQRYNIKGKVIQQLKLLSQGSFGFIWLAQDTNTKQKYALKRIVCITNDRLRLAKNQLQIMMKFPKCKNLVACHGGDLVTIRNGTLEHKVIIILMDYCPNGTLFDLLSKRQNKGFTQKELLQITQSILEGLKYIHQIGLYHEDVKIQNVLIGQDNSFKLCDFGSCSNRIIDFASINKSQYNIIKEQMESVTTPMYRPPEMVDPYLQYQVSFKVDVWMVGCVLYTLAYFTHPFVDSNAIGIASGVYRFPRYPEQTQYQVSDKIKDLIRNFLTPNPAFRPTVQQSLQIINNWHTISQVPLNKQARRRKEQQKIKQKELQVLNRKVVQYDGDIPIQKLMELQNKIKNKDSVSSQVKHTSFITSKDTKLIKEGKILPSNKVNQPQKQLVPQNIDQPKPKQQQNFDMNSFWNNPANNSSSNSNANKFDAFTNFFQTSHQSTASKNNQSDMYDEFFSEGLTKPQPQPQKTTKSNEVNLLDL